MTTGEEIKKALGLESYRYVMYTRCIGTSYSLLLIYYDSLRPNIPITNHAMRYTWNILSARRYPFNKEMPTLPLMPLETYQGIPEMVLTFAVDLAGLLGKKDKQIQRESVESYPIKVNEWMTIKNLKTPDAMSNFTKKFKAERNKLLKPENFIAKLVNCEYDKQADAVTFTFEAKATYDDQITSKVDPETFQMEPNPDHKYTEKIKILDFMKWLKGTRPDEMSDQPITWREVKDVLQVAYIQVWCNCPSTTFQGLDYWLTQLDGAIYPNDIEPKRWNAPHLHGDGNAFVCKHMGGLLMAIDFFLNPMASKLNKTLKQIGEI